MNKLLILLVCGLFVAATPAKNHLKAPEPIKITWDQLKDVTFKKKWYAEEQVYMLYPTFGATVSKLDGKEVSLKGYVIPVDLEQGIYVLSAFPYAMCFFCGGAGPESVVALKFKKGGRRFKTDEVHTFKGKLKLNPSDIYELNYIIQDAEVMDGQ